MSDILAQIRRLRIVPVIALQERAQAVPLADALAGGGLPVMEITFRTQAGLPAIEEIASRCPQILVGAGTVTTLDQARDAVRAGAKFLVSPGLDPEVVTWCQGQDVAVLPGCVTPTEVLLARKLGLDTVKFFPAETFGGTAALKALAGPYPDMRFVPTGGVGPGNLASYLKLPNVLAVGGSWMAPAGMVARGEFEAITRLCREAVSAAAAAGVRN